MLGDEHCYPEEGCSVTQRAAELYPCFGKIEDDHMVLSRLRAGLRTTAASVSTPTASSLAYRRRTFGMMNGIK